MSTAAFIGQARIEKTSTRYKFRSYKPEDTLYGLEEAIKTTMTDIQKEYYDLSKKIHAELLPFEDQVLRRKEVELLFYYEVIEPKSKS